MPELPTPVRVGVVGAGYFGQFHYDAWSRMEGVELVGLTDPDAERAAETATAFGGTDGTLPAFDDLDAMIATVKPDLIDITAPPAVHLKIIEAACPHVGHIICQKPFCGGPEGARSAIAAANAQGARLAVHENFRFQPWYGAAKTLIDAGALGEIYQVTFRLRPGDGQGPEAYLDRQPYFQKMERFLIHETGIHWVDTFRYLLGEVTGVFARLDRLNPAIAGEDAGLVFFDFAGGARGVLDANRLSDHAATNRRRTMGEMWIEGSAATLRLDGDGRLWLRPFGENDEREHSYDWNDHLFGGDCVYRCCLSIVADWQAGRSSPMEAEHYIRNQEIAAAIYDSAANGRYITV